MIPIDQKFICDTSLQKNVNAKGLIGGFNIDYILICTIIRPLNRFADTTYSQPVCEFNIQYVSQVSQVEKNWFDIL